MAKNNIIDLNIFDNNDTSHKNANGGLTGENLSSTLYDMIAIPNWSIRDFAIERWRFKTQSNVGSTVSPYGEPGMFFYKVLFNFNTSYGLLGGLVKESNGTTSKDVNTAWQFLKNNIGSARFSKGYSNTLELKLGYLEKFGKLLNFISNECPWFFKDVDGLSEALKYNFDELVPQKNRTIKITFNQDAVDMRVSTLIDLYKQACYDWVNFKEIIPENLRKFDMCIMLFNPPIAGVNFNGDITIDDMKFPNNSSDTASYKQFSGNVNDPNAMSFKCIYLKNCEIVIDELNSFEEKFNNESGFAQELSMTVSFERHYSYNINKELKLMVADSGLIMNNTNVSVQTPVTPTNQNTTPQTDTSHKINTDDYPMYTKNGYLDEDDEYVNN